MPQKEYNMLLIITESDGENGITTLRKNKKNWNLYNEQKRKIYRRRYLRMNDLLLTPVPLRISSYLDVVETELPSTAGN